MKDTGAMRRMALMVGVIFLSVGTTVALTPTFAAGGGGGGGGGGGAAKTCPKGQVYSPKKQSCVRQKSELVPDDALADYAFALAKEKRFDEALEILDQVQNPNTPKALNYRGYIIRKLGRTEEGIGYYLKSVALDPHYVQVREYLGEAYVTQGKLDLAKEQLNVIGTLCGTVCEEYLDLSEAIKTASN
jgi:tetratricopeptide (TPR) repeat protein